MNRLTTSEVAKQGGVNLETVRYYERRGLLPKPPRNATGYRAFEPDAVRRLRTRDPKTRSDLRTSMPP